MSLGERHDLLLRGKDGQGQHQGRGRDISVPSAGHAVPSFACLGISGSPGGRTGPSFSVQRSVLAGIVEDLRRHQAFLSGNFWHFVVSWDSIAFSKDLLGFLSTKLLPVRSNWTAVRWQMLLQDPRTHVSRYLSKCPSILWSQMILT